MKPVDFIMGAVLVLPCLFAQQPPHPQPVTAPEWVAVYRITPAQPLDPEVRIHVVVRGFSEGDAAIAGYRYLEAFMSDMRKLAYIEACERKERK